VRDIVVSGDGVLRFGGQSYRCALGRSGLSLSKREGDGATPAGRMKLRNVLYRADRIEPPRTQLAIGALAQTDGWCDDPTSPDYNCKITLPHPARHEDLWREDTLYDLLAVIGYNDDPPVAGLGSAIFLHVAQPDYAPTEGCVALALSDLRTVLAGSDTDTWIVIGA
jgi:L,D-peptidoglycan transpeptidase YkuD (ErfK/YbiS/YcfS/YnhG family)